MSSSTLKALSEKKTLRNKIDDVKTIVPKFLKLLEVMDDVVSVTSFVD